MTRAQPRAPLAWALNLDAEHELEAGPRYQASAATRRAMSAARARLARMLPAGDVVLDGDDDASARGLEGRCWCPTPSARARLVRAGALPPDAPPVDVLRRVNERGFAFALGHLPGARRCAEHAQVLEAIAEVERAVVKRGLGFAGRGQRRIDRDRVSDADRRWIAASLGRGALYVEPRVPIVLEVALHGLVRRDGSVERGAPAVQRVEGGAWRESRLAAPGELREPELRALEEAFERVSAALLAAGYFGPFGIDALRYERGGRERFHPLSELNARYTMAWGTGMGAFR